MLRIAPTSVLLLFLAAPVTAQAPPTMAALATEADQVVSDAEKTLAAAAPEAYKAYVSALRLRINLRARMAADAKPAPSPPVQAPPAAAEKK